MNNKSIIVNNLSKIYKIKKNKTVCNYKNLREDIYSFAKKLIKKEKKRKKENFFALKNLSLEIKKGEIIGIIGANGSGKSTFLKLLSRITSPSSGEAKLYGRVGALLEVGTGFHPELTGRENIFLNGSILGMKKSEIIKSFDEIIDFAGIETFLETPVKRYSTGMFLRLAFSVMAHLRSEILLVDEVLAVGDVAFQKKCLNQMDKVAKKGRTVIFVSHQLESILSLCSKCIFLEKGILKNFGKTKEVVDHYYQKIKTNFKNIEREGRGNFQFFDFCIENENGNKVDILHSGQPCRFVLPYRIKSKSSLKKLLFEINIYTPGNMCVTTLRLEKDSKEIKKEGGKLSCIIDKLPLNSGFFHYNLVALNNGIYGEIEDKILSAGSFKVEPGNFYKNGFIAPKNIFMHFDHKWENF